MRVKRGNVARNRRKKVLKKAKGFRGSGHRLFRAAANIAVIRAGVYAYRDRRKRKTTFRQLWIQRINAIVRDYGLSYSKFIGLLNKANIKINRKLLAELAVRDAETFSQIVKSVKA